MTVFHGRKSLSSSSGPVTGNRFGVRISKELKAIKNIVGRDFILYFDIVDNRRLLRPPNYNVRVRDVTLFGYLS